MAFGRKSARIAELEAQVADAAAHVDSILATMEECGNVTADALGKARDDVAFAERVAAQAVERRDLLLHRVGDRMAARLPECAAEWEAAKNGVAWRDERGRFLPRSER